MRKFFVLILSIAFVWTCAISQAETSPEREVKEQVDPVGEPNIDLDVEPQDDAGVETLTGEGIDTLYAPDVGVAAQGDTLTKALLWQITGDSINTSYLFGTIHLIPEEDYFLPVGTEEAFALADLIVFEIDMNEMTDIGAQMGLLMKAMMPDGQRLRDLISEEDYALVKAHFDEMGLPLVMLERIKPMFLSVFASGDISMDDLSSGSSLSYEMEFFDLANAQEKEVGGLETMAFQISVFDSIPYEVQAEMLVESIRSQDDSSEQFQEMIDTYRSQDIEKLHAMLTSGEEDLGGYEDLLVTNRNKNWIGLMSPMMKEGSVFFAVGAGHLGGYNGVVRLLQRAGYEVTPILGELDTTSRPKKRF